MRPSEILRRYHAGERDFRGVDVEAALGDSFVSARLDGADFSGAFLVADFLLASLRGCRFVEANVKTCAFDGADLRGCDFSRAAIDGATFGAAQLEGAIFDGAHAQGHTFAAGKRPA